jgi:hypothetical protein
MISDFNKAKEELDNILGYIGATKMSKEEAIEYLAKNGLSKEKMEAFQNSLKILDEFRVGNITDLNMNKLEDLLKKISPNGDIS